jgi:diguanylate cyclase (GGDEF)-like protein
VFRIGGDEFLVVLQNGDLENCDALFRRFEETCNKTFINESIKIPIRIALGFARFDESRDVRFENVFQRADVAMYENKKMMKSRPDLNSEQ